MKTLVCVQPGMFEYREMNAPLASAGQAIIKIKRIGICGTDLHAFEGTQPFLSYPRILGHELSGDLVDFDGAPGFVIGERVTVIPYLSCGNCIACQYGKSNCCVNLRVLGVHMDGGMVEYLSVPSALLVHGNGLSEDELALVEPFAIGAHAIRRAAVIPGEFVLVVGAGPIGLGVMEAARLSGAEVIAMDVQEDKLRFCRENWQVLHTINASGLRGAPGSNVTAGQSADTDVTERLLQITGGNLPTLVIDATGNHRAIQSSFQYLAHGGRYVLVGIQKENICFSHPDFHKREATLMSSRNATREDFDFVMKAFMSGKAQASSLITHRAKFGEVKDVFASWLDPSNKVIKAMVSMD